MNRPPLGLCPMCAGSLETLPPFDRKTTRSGCPMNDRMQDVIMEFRKDLTVSLQIGCYRPIGTILVWDEIPESNTN